MKQVSNSLLTLYPIPFKAFPDASAFPRDTAGANGYRFTPFYIRRENAGLRFCAIPGLSCSPRSIVRFGLGEGRIRNLLLRAGFRLFSLCAILACAPALAGAGVQVIELKQEAAVRSDVVHLEDVADLRGADANQLRRLAQIELGPSPEFGLTSTLSRQQIQSSVQKMSGLSLPDVEFAGAAAVQIGRRGRLPDPGEIEAALKTNILETTSWKESEIEVRSIGKLSGIELPPDDAQLRLAPHASLTGRKRVQVPVEIVQAGKTLRSFWITADISIRAPILTASRKIPYNKAIVAEDIVQSMVEIPDLRASYARRPEDLIGKVARRSLPAGTPLTCDAFADPFLVRHGETVQLRLEGNGIVLTSLAKAEQDGRINQVITVRDLEFSTPLKAQVTGRGTVRIQ
jgi:flagella basal body P-ring formation protein FlgA